MQDDDRPRAFFDGKVLYDPDGAAVMRAVETHNCKMMLREHHRDRLVYFTERIVARGLTPSDVVIVVINADAPYGAAILDVLMPDHDWAAIRARGEVPYGRGLATRESMTEVCRLIDPDVAAELAAIPGVAVVMVDRGIVAVFKVGDVVLDG